MVLNEQTPIKIIITTLLLLVAISLLVKGKRRELKGVTFLGLAFIALAAILVNRISTDLLPFAFTSGRTYFSLTISCFYVLYAFFTHFTFYGGKTSPVKYIIMINIMAAVIMLVLTISAELLGEWANTDTLPSDFHIFFSIALYINIGMNVINSGWRFNTSRVSYGDIKENEAVEDWIKMRYKFVMISSILWIIVGITMSLIVTSYSINLFTSLTFFPYLGLEIISWGAPKKIKSWANRNFTIKDQSAAMSEEEILKQMGDN